MPRRKVVVLSGGVGGARFANGLCGALDDAEVMVVVNTGDDFTHLGLAVSPDLDTVMYTLAGIVNSATGWGRATDTTNCLEALRALGHDPWFLLGDRDLAVHIERTRRLREGVALHTITADFCRALGVRARIVPVSDEPITTIIATDEGALAFQDYFVRRCCAPRVAGVSFEGAARAALVSGIAEWLDDPALTAVFIGPSNPFLSIEPMLAVPGLRDRLQQCPVPVVAISPLVGGNAVKGPAAKMMREMGMAAGNATVAERYAGLLDGMVVHERDAVSEGRYGDCALFATDTLMLDVPAQERLGAAAMAFAESLAR